MHLYSQLPLYTFISANVSLVLSERVVSLSEFDCPGDTVSYMCAITSNTEALRLVWSVASSDMVEYAEVVYEQELALPSNVNDSDDTIGNVNSVLLTAREGYILSRLTVTVLNASTNGTVIECSIGELGSDLAVLTVNTSGE